ncbi:MAG: hypothetical protein QW156_04480 [Candidatus Aenigmatarchaeota archaeon]
MIYVDIKEVEKILTATATDKTYIDKILAKSESESLKSLIKKNELTREDLLEILYLLTGLEIKLSNFDEYTRYVLGKYFTWIRELVKIAEFIYDYEEEIRKGEDDEVNIVYQQIKNMMLHNTKFAVDIFLYLSRSSLSLEGVAFDKLSKSRYEYEYGQQEMKEKEEKKFLGFK